MHSIQLTLTNSKISELEKDAKFITDIIKERTSRIYIGDTGEIVTAVDKLRRAISEQLFDPFSCTPYGKPDYMSTLRSLVDDITLDKHCTTFMNQLTARFDQHLLFKCNVPNASYHVIYPIYRMMVTNLYDSMINYFVRCIKTHHLSNTVNIGSVMGLDELIYAVRNWVSDIVSYKPVLNTFIMTASMGIDNPYIASAHTLLDNGLIVPVYGYDELQNMFMVFCNSFYYEKAINSIALRIVRGDINA